MWLQKCYIQKLSYISDKANSINHTVYCLFLTFSGIFCSCSWYFSEDIQYFAFCPKVHVNLIVSVALEVYTGLFPILKAVLCDYFFCCFFRIVLWRPCELLSLNNLPADPTDLFQSLRALLLDILLTFSTAFWSAFSDYFACYFYRFIPKISSYFLGYFCLQFPQICFMNWQQIFCLLFLQIKNV